MASIFFRVREELDEFNKLKDARADNLPFTSVESMLALTVAYVALIRWGPPLMAQRKALQLRGPIMLYDVLQVTLNTALLLHSVYELAVDPTPYVWQCSAPHTDSSTHYGRLEFRSVYAYHALKVLDLLDTVFFVLRKKTGQLSFLHIYHHMAVVWGTWLSVNFHAGGHFAFLGLLNAFVHAIMYAYYFAALYRPAVKQSLAVKRLVTLTQMVQFAVLIVHSGWPLVTGRECATHKFLLALCTVQNAFLMCMFGDFYVRSYVWPRRSK